MKQLLPLFILSFVLCSCIDKDFDLSKIDTDNTTIGDETTELDAPLATLTVRMAELTDGTVDIETMFEEADLWLPTSLPDGASWVDLVRLQHDGDYLDKMLDAFFTQTANDQTKLVRVASLVWTNYRQRFISLLPLPEGVQVTESMFREVFIENFSSLQPLQSEIRGVATDYLSDLKLKDLSYEVGKIDLSSDVVDMLVDNLDPKGAVNPKNTLDLYGWILSGLPLGVTLSPDFVNTDVDFDVIVEGPDVRSDLPMTRLYADDLRTIMAGVTIRIPILLEKYYPSLGFDSDMQIRITLQLKRRGGLKLNL